MDVYLQNARETGFVEKMLHSYGFVQCCDREARLFFHYSEFQGDIETLNPGDAVEFQMSYDRRSGRPVACHLAKVDPGLVSCEIYSEERYIGSVVQEAKPAKPKNVGASEVSSISSFILPEVLWLHVRMTEPFKFLPVVQIQACEYKTVPRV